MDDRVPLYQQDLEDALRRYAQGDSLRTGEFTVADAAKNWSTSHDAAYSRLERGERDGHFTSRSILLGGNRRKVYRFTPEGLKHIAEVG